MRESGGERVTVRERESELCVCVREIYILLLVFNDCGTNQVI